MSVRRYLKDAFFADQARALLGRIVQARRDALGRRHEEALHDWRVLVRRLIEFSRRWAARPMRKGLLPLAEPWIEASNAARDAEVEVAAVAALRKEARTSWAATLDDLDRTSQADLAREFERLTAFLADPGREAEEGQVAALLEPLPHYALAPRRLPKRLKRSIRLFESMLNSPANDLEALHKLRLSVKSMRYGFEPLALLDPGLKPVLAELTALQRALGDHRDWQRLADKARQADMDPELVQAMEARAAAAMANRPKQLQVTQKWLEHGWRRPPLGVRVLRRRLLRALPEAAHPLVQEALMLASRLQKGRKRADGSPGMVRPLRTALALLEEAGRGEANLLVTALLSGPRAGGPAGAEPDLAARFGGAVAHAAAVLAEVDAEPGEESVARLKSAPAWVRLVALARQLETLRFGAEAGKAGKVPAATLERIRAQLPLFRSLRLAGARRLFAQLDLLLGFFS